MKLQGKDESATSGPSNSSGAVADSEEILPDDDDDDELDLDELNELEASLSRTSIQICEPGIEASSQREQGIRVFLANHHKSIKGLREHVFGFLIDCHQLK